MKLGRKISGGKYIKRMKKKRYALPGQGKVVKLSGEEKRKIIRRINRDVRSEMVIMVKYYE